MLAACTGAAFAAAVMGASVSSAVVDDVRAREVSLKPAWSVGQTQRFDFRFESDRASGNAGNPAERVRQTFVLAGRISRRVEKVEGGVPTLVFVYESVRAEVKTPGNSLTFDSAKPAAGDGDNPMARSMRPVIGREITVKLNGRGDIETITGTEPAPAKDPGAARPPALSEALVGQEVFKRLLRPTYSLEGAPETAKIGATWTLDQDTTQPMVGVLTTHKVFTLRAVDGNIAKIEMTGDVDLHGSGGEAAKGAKLGTRKVAGTVEWDVRTGVVDAYNSTNSVMIEGDDFGLQKRVLDSTTTVRIVRVPAESTGGRE